MKRLFKGQRVLVTGACGTIGQELVRQLVEGNMADEIIGIDNNESELFFLEQKFSGIGNSRFFLADIRDHEKMFRVMKGMDIVFHSAAFKHVILCERSPFEAVQTNILGVQNIVSAAVECRVKKVIFTSSDKAVNPTNVMGTSKLMGERLITAANSKLRGEGPVFASTRFGNVLGSRGSVIPIFHEQIRRGGPVTITDREMTRFIMSISAAVQLVVKSANLSKGGEVFVTKMPAIFIQDLAEVMIRELAPKYGHRPEDIKIDYIGTKPGEKMYEELMNHEEIRRALELDKYFVITPAFRGIYNETEYEYPNIVSNEVRNPYNSRNEKQLTQDELLEMLRKFNLLEEAAEEKTHPAERYWPNGGEG